MTLQKVAIIERYINALLKWKMAQVLIKLTKRGR